MSEDSKFWNKWKGYYNSKPITAIRNFLMGNDYDLSDQQYLEKHGFSRPSTSAGILDLMKNPAEAAKAAKAVGKATGVVSKRPRVVVKKSVPNKYVVNKNLRQMYAEENTAKEAQAAADARAYDIKQRQMQLDKDLDRLAREQGINTEGWQKKAMMKSVEISPETTSPPVLNGKPEEIPLPTYRSGMQEYEGIPLREWFDMASEGMLPQGPNAAWRKWEKPLQSANNYFDTVGPMFTRHGVQAPRGAMQFLNEGLKEIKPLIKKEGGIVSAKSGIHIKKANRGKFTSYCGGKVTSACIARGKASSNPAIRKRATFAANARKWKHKNGGIIPFWIHNQIDNVT